MRKKERKKGRKKERKKIVYNECTDLGNQIMLGVDFFTHSS